MKKTYLNIAVVLTGLLIVFFFPEPETNFMQYMTIWIVFIVLLIWINLGKKGDK